MSPDISRVRFERLRCIGRLVYRRQGLLREALSLVLGLTSPEMGPVFKVSNTERHQGRRKLGALAPVPNEVELIRNTKLDFSAPLFGCLNLILVIRSKWHVIAVFSARSVRKLCVFGNTIHNSLKTQVVIQHRPVQTNASPNNLELCPFQVRSVLQSRV